MKAIVGFFKTCLAGGLFVTPLDVSIGDASRVVAHWGVGMSEIMVSERN